MNSTDGEQPDGSAPEESDEPYAGLSLPDDGFQVRSVGLLIEPGQDIEYCEVAEIPGTPEDTYYVTALELGNAAFGHHLVVSAAEADSPADAALRALDIGDRVPCFSAAIEFGDDGLVPIWATQLPYESGEMPTDTGIILHGGQRVVFDYHYVNTSIAPIQARSALNVHLADASDVKHIAQAFNFYNFTIDTPAGQSAAFTAECSFTQDVIVGGVGRHTHGFGTEFSIWHSGGSSDGQLVWTSDDWMHELGYTFPEPVLLRAGEGFRFRCAFDNPTQQRLRYGMKSTDEMCILAGTLWSPTGFTRVPSQNCEITWIDDDGIGRPASAGFPPASEPDAAACTLAYSLVGLDANQSAECGDCLCSYCGSILMTCVQDLDCAPVLACFSRGCATQEECLSACEPQLDAHSSAMGLIEQVHGCMSYRCPACAPD